jgi:hypothetical protein
MKIKKVTLGVKLSFVLVASLFFLFNCQTEEQFFEETAPVFERVKRQTSIIPFDKLPFQFAKPINDLEQTIKSNTKSIDDLLIVDHAQIVEVIDSLSNVRFSVRFRLPDQPDNIIYNLVLGADAQDVEINPFVLKYTINNPHEVYAQGFFDLSKMKGKISEYRLDTFLAYVDAQLNRTTEIEPQPCAEYSNEDEAEEEEDNSNNDTTNDTTNNNSGGGATGGTDGNNDNNWDNTHDDSMGGNGEFENTDQSSGDGSECDSVWVWSNGTTGEITGISWSCSDGSSGFTDLSRTETTDCPGNGDVGVNDGEDGPSCKSFNYTNTTSAWQEAAVINIKFHVYLYDGDNIRYLYTQLYSQPVLFGATSNLMNGGDLTAGVAAETSAIALNKAMEETVHRFRNTSVSETEVDLYFRERLKHQMKSYIPGGRATFNSGTTLPPTQYQTYALFRDKCI